MALIYIVEDDESIREIETIALKNSNYIVSAFENAKEFYKKLDELVPDLILLDYDMPGWNGKKTFEVVRQTENGKDIPVIFLTAIADKENIMAVLQMNPYGYLLKPPVRETLIEQIKSALS